MNPQKAQYKFNKRQTKKFADLLFNILDIAQLEGASDAAYILSKEAMANANDLIKILRSEGMETNDNA